MKRLLWAALLASLLLTAFPAVAQEATPEATEEAPLTYQDLVVEDPGFELTAADIELLELLASLEQSRTENGGFMLGDPNAPVTYIEFADWDCPHCQEYRATMETIIRERVATGEAAFEFRMFPTAGGEVTLFYGQIAECADNQIPGAFWTMYVLLYGAAFNYTYRQETTPLTLVNALGLDRDLMVECLTVFSEEGGSQVEIDVAYGSELGISGTPGVLVRFAGGDPEFIDYEGTTFNRGGPPLNVLESVLQQEEV